MPGWYGRRATVTNQWAVLRVNSWRIIEGDCREALRAFEPASVDAVVTDPPYGLGFMGKQWDTFDPTTMDARVGTRNGNGPPSDVRDGRHKGRSASAFANPAGEAGSYDFTPAGQRRFHDWTLEWASEALRVLKPGGHLLAFGGTRTYHRLVCAVEDAGFEIRDTIAWLYGSGFPKSLDVSKAIDKAAGAEREVVAVGSDGVTRKPRAMAPGGAAREAVQTLSEPITNAAREWQGWGTALKPAHEPIVVARKPLVGTVAANVLAHGTGALNVDGCRVGFSAAEPYDIDAKCRPNSRGPSESRVGPSGGDVNVSDAGRWPANVVLDEGAGAMLDEQTGELTSGQLGPQYGRTVPRLGSNGIYGSSDDDRAATREFYGDSGGASRFFYCAKADSAERNLAGRNPHPTVKPVALMRWLVRLVTPPDGLVLDPFAGSGTTGIAALREGFAFVGIEREAEYAALARERIRADAPLLNTPAEQVA